MDREKRPVPEDREKQSVSGMQGEAVRFLVESPMEKRGGSHCRG